jgi:hypothetical protein
MSGHLRRVFLYMPTTWTDVDDGQIVGFRHFPAPIAFATEDRLTGQILADLVTSVARFALE